MNMLYGIEYNDVVFSNDIFRYFRSTIEILMARGGAKKTSFCIKTLLVIELSLTYGLIQARQALSLTFYLQKPGENERVRGLGLL